jgi:hypothetical protein
MSIENCFLELSRSKSDEPRSLRCIFKILTHVLGNQKAAQFATFVMFPFSNETIINNIILQTGETWEITKCKKTNIKWPKLTCTSNIINVEEFDALIINGKKLISCSKLSEVVLEKSTDQVVGFLSKITGTNGQTYKCLPQHLNGDFQTWTLMQNMLVFPSFGVKITNAKKANIIRYITMTPGYTRPTKKLTVRQLLMHFATSFTSTYPLKRKRVEKYVFTTAEKKLAILSCKYLKAEQYQQGICTLRKLCDMWNVPTRLLTFFQQVITSKQKSSFYFDGCLFTSHVEKWPQCMFTTSQTFIKPVRPEFWKIILFSRTGAVAMPSSGICTPAESIIFAMPKNGVIPQIFPWSFGSFMQPQRLWLIWRKYMQFLENDSVVNISKKDQQTFGMTLGLFASFGGATTKTLQGLTNSSIDRQIDFLKQTWLCNIKCN